jgi:5-formyltetrahydrofolate cyclo-ligase
MSGDEQQEIQAEKRRLRQAASAARRALPDRETRSRGICERLLATTAYRDARTVLFYVDLDHEVQTRECLSAALAAGKRVLVPYCVGDDLGLFHLHHLDELEPRTFGILEPPEPLRALADRAIALEEVDLVVVPGVAFDPSGARLGWGRGYYDRLLREAPRSACLVGLAYECQIFPALPVEPHDVRMDLVISEAAVYAGAGR